jgi:hypothetical protein
MKKFQIGGYRRTGDLVGGEEGSRMDKRVMMGLHCGEWSSYYTLVLVPIIVTA